MKWDVLSKALIKENIQDFLTYLVPGAEFIDFVEGQLQEFVDETLDPREVRCDVVVKARLGKQLFLAHWENQSTAGKRMVRRMLTYGHRLECEHHLFTLSIAVYTQPIKRLPPRILKWLIPRGAGQKPREVLHYEHDVLDVCSLPVEYFRLLNRDGFRPFMLLAKGGATTAVLDEVLDALQDGKKPQTLAVAMIFASYVLKSDADRQYLERKCNMLDPILKDTWFYQKFWQEVDQEKVAKNREEAREEAREETTRQHIETFVEIRFPNILAWVKTQIQQINNVSTLQQILTRLYMANTADEIKAAFSIQH